jgi:hypothetical protein
MTQHRLGRELVFFSKQVQIFPMVVPVYEACGGVFVSTRRSTLAALRESRPEVESYYIAKRFRAFFSGNRVLNNAKVIVTGATHHNVLGRVSAPKAMLFHGCVNRLTSKMVESLSGFDHVFLQTPRLQRMLQRYGKDDAITHSVPGYLPFDRFTAKTDDNRRAILGRLNLDPDKPTIVYAPTRGIYGSWLRYGLSIAEQIPDVFNLVMRPHPHQVHGGSKEERASFAKIQSALSGRPGRCIDLDKCHLSELLSVADLLISDQNSTAEESLYYDLPQLFTEVFSRDRWAAQYRDEGIDEESIAELMGFYDCASSFDQLSTNNWGKAVEMALASGDDLSAQRKQYFAECFGPVYGRRVVDDVSRTLRDIGGL